MIKKIAVLGSTGSIGTQTLDVVRAYPDKLKVVALAAGANIDLLERQIEEFQPELVCVYDEEKAMELKKRLGESPVEVVTQMDGLISCATHNKVEMVVASVVGMIGILPVIEAVKAGKDIAFANKETLVTAGHIIMPLIKEHNVAFLPVDSEHSAIFQCIHGEKHQQISKLLLTASGGPFRGWSREQMAGIQLEDALKHPNWTMGQKITIDSSTMANKALEVIEAKWLFDVEVKDIQVIIQPQSLIHSMVEFQDGAIKAQLGTPDMHLPIQYALFYPEREYLQGDRVDFSAISQITFAQPDYENFRMLKLGLIAARTEGSLPTVYNAANEQAVALFLNKKIGYLDIDRIVEQQMNKHVVIAEPDIDTILAIEKEVRMDILQNFDR